jgi:hypothetical protein
MHDAVAASDAVAELRWLQDVAVSVARTPQIDLLDPGPRSKKRPSKGCADQSF